MNLRNQITDPDVRIPLQAVSGHVYLIDDNEDIRRHLSATLLRLGLSVSEFESAESFLSRAVYQMPSVVLLDMSLPGANGVKTFEQMRDADWDMPVIFISGQSEPMEIIDAMKLGANDFLWKPFSTAALIEAIKKAFSTLRIQSEMQTIDQARTNLWNAMTEREQEICKLMMDGCGNTEIANRLQVRADTIKKHRARILSKYSVATLSQLNDIFRGFEPPR